MVNDTAQRFWPKVRKTEGCWEWLAAKGPSGYGYFRVGKRHRLAHRHVLVLVGRDVPDDMCVCHRCDNPSCVNPAHLFIGSYADNVRDKIEKGRGTNGSANGQSKLCEEDIPRIRDMRRCGAKQKDVADLFGVSRELISQIDRGRVWKGVGHY